MTIIEAGIIAGAPAGATIGGMIGKSLGDWGVVGGVAAGLLLGGVAGWIYALLMICSLSVVGVLWRAVRQRSDQLPTEAEMERMTPIASFGTFAGIALALVGYLKNGWFDAAVAALAIALVTSVLAARRCEIE
jgi:hypothetical protein